MSAFDYSYTPWSPLSNKRFDQDDETTTPPPVISLGRIDIARVIQVLVVRANDNNALAAL